jgi:hypothetical protein
VATTTNFAPNLRIDIAGLSWCIIPVQKYSAVSGRGIACDRRDEAAPPLLRKLKIFAQCRRAALGRKLKFKLRHYQHRAKLDVVASHVLALRQPRREAPKARDNQPGAPELDDAIPFG